MRTIPQWLVHLFWRARPVPQPGPSGGLIVGLSFIGQSALHTQTHADIWLDTTTVDEAERILTHLARLGTVDRVRVFGFGELPPHDRRRLATLARRLRRLGMVVAMGTRTA